MLLSSIFGGGDDPNQTPGIFGGGSGSSFGSTVGGMLPLPFGSTIGGIVGGIGDAIGGLFGGHGAPDHEASDRGKIAAANGITDQQAADVVGNEERKVKDNYDTLMKRAANDNSYFLTLLNKYNSDNPGKKIVLNSYGGNMYTPGVALGVPYSQAYTPGVYPGVPTSMQGFPAAQIIQSAPVPTSQNFSNGDIKNVLNGMYQGAIAGGTNAALQTPEGQAAKNEGAKQWVNENGLIIGGVLAVVACIITWLASTRNKR